jgi:hypothetical protein
VSEMIRRDQDLPTAIAPTFLAGWRKGYLLYCIRQSAHPHLKPVAAFWNAPAVAGKPASWAWKLPTIATMSTAPICYHALGANVRVWSTWPSFAPRAW